jgi:predicted MFS family arabinose efflux permease
MVIDRRRLAVALAGLCAFLDLYAPQTLLPLFRAEFDATPAHASLTISATTLAVAMVAPFIGLVADTVGRKRLIVGSAFALVLPTLLLSLAPTLGTIIALRFIQGLLLPALFAVTVAYIGDEWPMAEVASVAGLYMAGSSLGGFLGRFLAGLMSDVASWRAAFVLLAAINLASAATVAYALPRERRFVRTSGLADALRGMRAHIVNPHILAILAVGFTVLFAFIAIFTYINFYLAAPPFGLSSGMLGSIFVVYLTGVVVSPWTGTGIRLLGRRRLVVAAVALWCAGLLLTLIHSLPAVMAGLALGATCGFICQTASTSLLTIVARTARSSAVGLYVTCYYIGGSCGGLAAGLAYHLGGWPACVALVICVLILMAVLVLRYWVEPEAAPAAA